MTDQLSEPSVPPEQGGPRRARRWNRKQEKKPVSVTCLVCCEDVNRDYMIKIPCGHQYCRECLRKTFEIALSDEASFPPRCCQRQIRPSGHIKPHLTDELVSRFAKCEVEFKTRNRTYCCTAQCSTFIEPKHIRAHIAQCPHCYTKTCTICKHRAHKSGNCPKDESTQEVIAMGLKNGWKRCYACGRMVELAQGCNHMTCRCGAQFCYTCGKEWKTCPCTQFRQDEPGQPFGPNTDGDAALAMRLQQEENEGLERLATHLEDPPEDPTLDTDYYVQQAALLLEEENQECAHTSWKRTRQRDYHCEQCYRIFPYVFQCNTCQAQMCRRCKDAAGRQYQ